MRKNILAFVLLIATGIQLHAQETMVIEHNDGTISEFPVSSVKKVYFKDSSESGGNENNDDNTKIDIEKLYGMWEPIHEKMSGSYRGQPYNQDCDVINGWPTAWGVDDRDYNSDSRSGMPRVEFFTGGYLKYYFYEGGNWAYTGDDDNYIIVGNVIKLDSDDENVVTYIRSLSDDKMVYEQVYDFGTENVKTEIIYKRIR